MYCITSVEQHQVATYNFGCSRKLLLLRGSFVMVNVLGRGDFLPAESGSRLVRGATHGGYTVVEMIQLHSQ